MVAIKQQQSPTPTVDTIEELNREENDFEITPTDRSLRVAHSEPHESRKTMSSSNNLQKIEFVRIAEEMFSERTNKIESNLSSLSQFFDRYEVDFALVLVRCPHFAIILSHIFILRFGWRVENVSWKTDMKDWHSEECRRVGRAFATFLRVAEQGEASVDAWSKNYPQLTILFDDVPGFR